MIRYKQTLTTSEPRSARPLARTFKCGYSSTPRSFAPLYSLHSRHSLMYTYTYRNGNKNRPSAPTQNLSFFLHDRHYLDSYSFRKPKETTGPNRNRCNATLGDLATRTSKRLLFSMYINRRRPKTKEGTRKTTKKLIFELFDRYSSIGQSSLGSEPLRRGQRLYALSIRTARRTTMISRLGHSTAVDAHRWRRNLIRAYEHQR